MAKNNHSATDNKKKLAGLLRIEGRNAGDEKLEQVLTYARAMADMENVLAVVSDMACDRSYIFEGGFAGKLGLSGYCHEPSIWEDKILSLMMPDEREEKYIAELRFFHYLRRLHKDAKPAYYLISKLRFRFADGNIHDVLHRMYYIYESDGETVRYAICLYGPLPFDFKGKSHAVNSITGISEELTSSADNTVLSRRERQVLSLIDLGHKSAEIADTLNISIHTVSRHRQDIIARLKVKNSAEACRLAKSMGIL